MQFIISLLITELGILNEWDRWWLDDRVCRQACIKLQQMYEAWRHTGLNT